MSEWRADNVRNAFSKLGTRGDRHTHTAPTAGRTLDDHEIVDLYMHDRFARLIVDRPAEDATRRGWEIEIEDHEDDPFADDLKRLKTQQKFRLAHEWARLRGGAGVVMIVDDDGQLNEPITGQVRGVKALHVFSRKELVPAEYIGDIEDPEFGEPSHYWLHPHTRQTAGFFDQVVHADRVLRFEGLPVPRDHGRRIDREGWGQPVLEAAWHALADIATASQAVASAMHEFQFGIIKLQNLKDLIAAGAEDAGIGLDARLDAIALGRSYIRSIVLDAEEDYELRQTNFSGLLDAYEVAQQNLSAVTRIPLTLLFGQSPKGFSSADETGLQNYWDGVRALQQEVYEPNLQRLVELLAAAKNIGDDWFVRFKDLDTPSEKDDAEIRKTYAEIDAINIDRGVYTADEARSRYSHAGFIQDLTIQADELDDDETFAQLNARLRQIKAEGRLSPEGEAEATPPDVIA